MQQPWQHQTGPNPPGAQLLRQSKAPLQALAASSLFEVSASQSDTERHWQQQQQRLSWHSQQWRPWDAHGDPVWAKCSAGLPGCECVVPAVLARPYCHICSGRFTHACACIAPPSGVCLLFARACNRHSCSPRPLSMLSCCVVLCCFASAL
jgi:hypothetical protein